jgi:hypothetical protein
LNTERQIAVQNRRLLERLKIQSHEQLVTAAADLAPWPKLRKARPLI